MHGFDIPTYCLLLSYLERITAPRKENTTAQIQKDNISVIYQITKYLKYGHFYFKIWRNKMREILASQNLQLTA